MSDNGNRICFAIQAHHEPELCERLIRMLCLEGDAVILHIDRKVPDFRKRLLEKINDVQGVHVIPAEESIRVNWSGYSQVQATLVLLKHFFALPSEFRWFSFHSGQDYPIKPIGQYRKFLIERNVSMLLDFADDRMLWRCQVYNLFRENQYNRTLPLIYLDKLIRNIQLPFVQRNKDIPFRKGSSLFTADRQTVKKILDADNKKWQSVWKYTACPDEYYFHTLSQMLEIPVICNNYRFLIWLPGSSSPEIFREEHLDDLLTSEAFFARKFSYQHRGIIDSLDQAMASSTPLSP